MHKHLTLLLIAAIAATFASCSGGAGLAAMKAYEIGEYDKAEKLLSKAYSQEKNKYMQGQYSFYLGECYRKKRLYRKAVSSYGRAIRNRYADDMALLYMAECMRANGDFEGAADAYQRYINKTGGSLQADNGLASCKMAVREWDAISNYDYKEAPDSGYVIRPAKQFNSKYSDYSPAFVGDDYDVVYFTSMRVPKRHRKMNKVTGQGNSTIYMSQIDGGGEWTIPTALEEPFGSKYDDGTPSLTPDGKTMFFTRCPYDETKANTAECYEMQRSGGRWSGPVRVIPGGDSTMMVAHPAISNDGNTLYFVSDKKGGRGGKDIYYTQRNADGTWSEAQNMGPFINTKGDEMFPYMRSNGVLYFASDGHPGYGGLDIFKAELNENGQHTVTNMGVPINSNSDDFGIIFRGNAEAGYLSSGRRNGKGYDNIYEFELPDIVIMIAGIVTDASGAPVRKSFVRIVGSDGTNTKLPTTDEGYFGMVAAPDTKYVILCGAKGYANQKFDLTTVGRGKSYTMNINVKLQPINK